MGKIVGAIDKAGLVHGTHEHLEADDGVDDDDEDDEEGDLDEGKERHHDCIEHNLFNIISSLIMRTGGGISFWGNIWFQQNLQAGNPGDKPEWSENSERTESLCIETLQLGKKFQVRLLKAGKSRHQ